MTLSSCQLRSEIKYIVRIYPFADDIYQKFLQWLEAIARHHKMVSGSDKVTMAFLLQILIDAAHVSSRQLLRILPLKLDLPLNLADITEQIL